MHLVNQSSLARTCIVASLSLVLAAVLAVVAQAPAHASDQVQRHTYHQGFSKSGITRFYTPNICIRWTVNGVLNYRANHIIRTDDVSGQKAHAYAIDRVNLSTNSLTVRGRKPDGSSCTGDRKTWSKVRLTQQMRGFGCSFSPSLSVSAPFSVGVGFWPSCGDKKLAHLTDTIDGRASKFTMLHSEEHIGFKGSQSTDFTFDTSNDLTWKCYGSSFRIKVWRVGDASDVKSGPRVPACPAWSGSTAGW